MSRDKAKDDKYFNCQQEHELEYVSSLAKKIIRRRSMTF